MIKTSKSGEILRRTPSGHVLFCDDVRQEVTGKFIFVGAYNTDIQFHSAFPVAVTQLFACVTYMERPEDGQAPITLVVEGPSEDPIWFSQEFPMPENRDIPAEIVSDPESDDPTFCFNWFLPLGPRLIERPGRIGVSVIKGDQRMRIGSLRVVGLPSAETSQG